MSYPDGVPSDICDIIVRTTSANRSKPFPCPPRPRRLTPDLNGMNGISQIARHSSSSPVCIEESKSAPASEVAECLQTVLVPVVPRFRGLRKHRDLFGRNDLSPRSGGYKELHETSSHTDGLSVRI